MIKVRSASSENYIGNKASKSFEIRVKGKKKHQLILRRNTCTSLDGLVAHDFWTTMQDAVIRDAFHEFLAKRRCTENLLFYEAVMKWKFQCKDGRWAEANRIFDMFIADQAPSQLNISAKTSNKIKEDLNTIRIQLGQQQDPQFFNEYKILPTTLFNAALREVELSLKLELLPNFADASLILKTHRDHRTCVIL